MYVYTNSTKKRPPRTILFEEATKKNYERLYLSNACETLIMKSPIRSISDTVSR